MSKKEYKENFYIALPNKFDTDLVVFSGKKFSKCFLKCGEMINETFEARYRTTGPVGGMCCIYKFYCDTNIIDKNRDKSFDTVLFGHGNVKNVWNKTIWKYTATIPTSDGRKDGYGQEYMDCAKLLNEWIKNTPSAKNYIDAISQLTNIDEQREIIKDLIICLFETNFNYAVEKFSNTTVEKDKLNMYKHQCLVLRVICDLLNKGKHNIVTQIPCRFGKTLTFLYLFANSPWKVMFVSSYTKTVGNSYTKEINKYEEFANIQTVNIDDISNFEYREEAKVVIEFPTTGSINSTIEKRIENTKEVLKQIYGSLKNALDNDNEMFLLNEEADFGQHTEKTDAKFEKMMNEFNKNKKITIISTTGTEAYKAEKLNSFGKFDGFVSVNKNDWHQIFGK